MPKDDGLVADVQSRASSALYNWNRPFNDQSAAYYKARHREDIELNHARRARRAADILDVNDYRKRQLYRRRSQPVFPDRGS
jgi:hypothetical protein